ncbi:MAG: hypothetical protein K9G62_02970 [Alphaproteobacteria bacterium]|nr:hypothetical protein [Alphaproteobacteria bacterium]
MEKEFWDTKTTRDAMWRVNSDIECKAIDPREPLEVRTLCKVVAEGGGVGGPTLRDVKNTLESTFERHVLGDDWVNRYYSPARPDASGRATFLEERGQEAVWKILGPLGKDLGL